ncbi:MAG: hypothetical protein J6125_02515, partial [Clostridia bacterium]|nr:hypothetical protein [Clostridia bacterium]
HPRAARVSISWALTRMGVSPFFLFLFAFIVHQRAGKIKFFVGVRRRIFLFFSAGGEGNFFCRIFGI